MKTTPVHHIIVQQKFQTLFMCLRQFIICLRGQMRRLLAEKIAIPSVRFISAVLSVKSTTSWYKFRSVSDPDKEVFSPFLNELRRYVRLCLQTALPEV